MEAKMAHAQGITIFVVGIGDQVGFTSLVYVIAVVCLYTI